MSSKGEGQTLSSFSIAIDGPAGAGKSTLARLMASRLKMLYIDTGAMYRAATWLAIKQKLALDDGDAISKVLKEQDLKLASPNSAEDNRIRVFINQEEITEAIRSGEVSEKVSFVAALPQVREVLVEQQRKLAQRGSAILDGRDIGSVVLPNANLKIFLTASAQERARRRVKELKELGEEASFELVLKGIVERDDRDSSRATSPLIKAEDAIEVDTDGLTIEEVLDKLIALYKEVASKEELKTS